MLTDKLTELHQFRKESSYDSDLSPCQIQIWSDKAFEFESGNVDGQTNRQKKDWIRPISKPSYLKGCGVKIKLNFYNLIPYLVDKCICWSR